MSYFLRETGEYGEMGTYLFAKVLCKSRDLCGNFCKAKSPTYYDVCIYALTGFSVPSLPNTQFARLREIFRDTSRVSGHRGSQVQVFVGRRFWYQASLWQPVPFPRGFPRVVPSWPLALDRLCLARGRASRLPRGGSRCWEVRVKDVDNHFPATGGLFLPYQDILTTIHDGLPRRIVHGELVGADFVR